jgi:hypothetical protein
MTLPKLNNKGIKNMMENVFENPTSQDSLDMDREICPAKTKEIGFNEIDLANIERLKLIMCGRACQGPYNVPRTLFGIKIGNKLVCAEMNRQDDPLQTS